MIRVDHFTGGVESICSVSSYTHTEDDGTCARSMVSLHFDRGHDGGRVALALYLSPAEASLLGETLADASKAVGYSEASP